MKKSFKKYYVLDTNIILTDAYNLVNLSSNGENLIILPETTIDELDVKKVGFEEINYQARQFGRLLAEAEVLDTHKVGADKNVTIMEIKINDNVIIHIVSFKDYGLGDLDKHIINDRKIIKVAEFASSFYKKKDETYLLSDDIMCRTRAISLNVNSMGLKGNSDQAPAEFIKELPLDSFLFNSLKNKPIQDYDKDYKPENYCYKFLSNDGNSTYGYIINERINIIDNDTFKGCVLQPLNLGQKFAMAGMLDSRVDISYNNAIAGSGKTLLALAAGMRGVDLGHYSKILYIRNSIESLDKGEEVGFLSGNEEKFKIYNYPLYDSLDFIARKSLGDKKPSQEDIDEKVTSIISKYNIECLWVGALRGRSLDNAYICIDEHQNISQKTMQTILTRLGKNCKVVLAGSSNQIDNLYLNRYTNADAIIAQALRESQDLVVLFATTLDKVVRGNITEFAEKLFTKTK